METATMESHYLLLLVIIFCVDSGFCRCPNGFQQIQNYNSCYKIVTKRGNLRTWVAARKECQRIGSDLAILDTDEEQQLLIAGQEPSEGFWIGLTDTEVEGNWTWLNGEPFMQTSKWYNRTTRNGIYNPDCTKYNLFTERIESFDCLHELLFDFSVCEKESTNGSCESAWIYRPNSNSCYHWHYPIGDKAETWFIGRQSCRGFGGDLISITSIEERNWFFKTFSPKRNHTRFTDRKPWIGLHNVAGIGESANWTWVDGTPLRPDIISPPYLESRYSTEDCAVIFNGGDVGVSVNDFHCDVYSHPYICETSTIADFCKWPPSTSLNHTNITCVHPTDGEVQCIGLLETGVVANIRCASNSYPHTGIPLCTTECLITGSWTYIGAFRCIQRNDD